MSLCRESAQSTCAETATCQPKDFRYPSVDACVATQKAMCDAVTDVTSALGFPIAQTYGSSGMNVDWNRFIDCTRKKLALGPSCKPPPNITDADVLAMREACSTSAIIHPGTRAAGAPCYVELQCQAGLTCSTNTSARGDAGLCGSCVALDEGASCAHASDCGLLLGMDCDTASKTCKRYARAGEACDTAPCDPTEYTACDRATKRCAPLARSGQSCASIDCDAGLFLYCSTADRTCKPTPRAAGDSCKPDGVCGAGLFCDPASFTCRLQVGEGGACASAPCDPSQGLMCTGSPPTCTSAYARVGDPCGVVGAGTRACWQSACAVKGNATQGTCVPYGLDGAACQDSGTCAATFSCVDGACRSEASQLSHADAAAYADAFASISACM